MAPGRERGVTLLVALLMLIAVLLVGTSAARMALQGEQSARADRDRQLALVAAEDGLMDAERDIDGNAGTERGAMFTPAGAPGFVDGCEGGAAQLGLCAHAKGAAAPAWQTVDLSGSEDGGRHTVDYGTFTGADMRTGSGVLPFRKPRYLIERLPCHLPGEEAGAAPAYCYRISVIGFGPRPGTEVVLQSVLRKAD